METEICYRQFTVDEYARMRDTGILSEDDRVELIEGEVRQMSPIGPQHAAVVNRLNAMLNQAAGDMAIVSVQNPIRIDDYTEPQPDLAILRPRDDFYGNAHPQARDVLLVVEVADMSLPYDREEKLPRYAASGIPEAWVVDVNGRAVEQYTEPRGGRYHAIRVLERGDALRAVATMDVEIPVDRIFGGA